jgi:ectoine hydroxylase-related dioxygenase (phytanoyl-CoA dioxygenase family)
MPLSHRSRGGDDDSLEPCYGAATQRVSKGVRNPAEDSDPKTMFSMFRHDMYPHVTVSLEPGDAVFFWQDVVHNGVAYKEDCNNRCCISIVRDS